MKNFGRCRSLLLALLLLALAGCGGQGAPENAPTAPPAPTAAPAVLENGGGAAAAPPAPTAAPAPTEAPAAPEEGETAGEEGTALLADTYWRAAYYITQDQYGQLQQDPGVSWRVDLLLRADGSALLRADHLGDPSEQDCTWAVEEGALSLAGDGFRCQGDLIQAEGELRLRLRLTELGEYLMRQEPVPEPGYLPPETRMQELVGNWELVSGVTEGWVWTAAEADQQGRLALYPTGEGMALAAVLSDGSRQPEKPLVFVEERSTEWGEVIPWHMETMSYESRSGDPEQLQLTLLDDHTLRTVRSYWMDGYPVASTQYYWREGTQADEAAAAAAVAELLPQAAPEGLVAVWYRPELLHPCCPAWQELGLTPTLIIALAPEVTVTCKEGEPVFDEADGTTLVDWEEYAPVSEPVTLRRGEYLYLGLWCPRYAGERARQYLEMEVEGEVWVWSVEEEGEPGSWLSIVP